MLHVEAIKDYRSHVPSKGGGVGKATLFQSPRLLLGLNCLEPGVEQRVHTHEGQDKFYHVLEGHGEFTVGDDVREAGVGHTVWAPAEVLHGVRNRGEERLVLLVGIAPSPS
jgi:mannose-6-phosphate isomerase-like protein (cupin superfamily)